MGTIFAQLKLKRHTILKIIFLLFFSGLTLFATSIQEDKIKHLIEEKFLTHYPSMNIENITIKPTSTLIHKLKEYKVSKVAITKDDLRRNKGSILVTFAKNHKQRKLYYKYNINATINLYVANEHIQKGRIITPNIVNLESIKFKSLYHEPFKAQDFNQYYAKYTIKENRPLTYEKLKKNRAIKRNDHVTAIIQDGGVVLNFKATALQEGDIGDIINIRKSYKKRFKAQIISNTTVKVLP